MAYTLAALDAELPSPEMRSLVTEILASSLHALGLRRHGMQTLADLFLEKPPAAYYERWLHHSLRYLRDQNVLGTDLTFIGSVRPLGELWNTWDAQSAAWATNPNQRAQSALLEACLRAVPGILAGKQRATDVMFPSSSMHLVEGVYRGNPQANYFNDVLADALTACIEQQLQSDPGPIRILEIGAGTGGTTATLLPLLQRYPVDEYCYTDVSKSFLMHAEKVFRPQSPALKTAIFDVTEPLESQSIAANRYDFTIAANVLHATPNIRDTVRNAKATLKNQGVLLLNEISAWSLFNHLTFGLLDGWWLYEDGAVRLEGSPGVAPETWREILSREGFESILFPAEKAHRFGQQIVAAVSNGWTRQRIVKHAAPPIGQAATQLPHPPRPSEPGAADHVRQVVTARLAEALKMDAGTIRGDASFADYGVDSIIGVNLVRTINETLQIELETTSLFEYSTVDELTAHILENWHAQIASRFRAGGDTAPTTTLPGDARTTDTSAPRAETDVVLRTRFASAAGVIAATDGIDSQPIGVEPIAVIGMSGRFAQSESLEAFWQHLADGTDLVTQVTRWAPRDCVMPGAADGRYCHHGSFIDSIDRFDPAFFGISALEAAYMDPQQRLFLEESWKALEDAGYAGKGVHERQCGVYVGCGSSNYDKLASGDTPPQAFWGNSQAVTPARIAYCLNLQGPAIAVDTACSSSLVAIHLACQGLWSRETEMAVAGGVFLQPTPGFYQVANRAGMLSPAGKCRSFDAGADGFVPGEGVGVVVLKRLRDAVADGDHVHGVIAASGINQDGRSNGLIAPNGRAQERLERSVYERFHIDPETIQVVEAHGTGTLLGDSIEYGALSRAFRAHTDRQRFCALGTVKTNIGHTSTAAGVAGVLKLLLALKHRRIPPSLHFEKGNPAVDVESGPFYVNTQLREWTTEDGQPRRAAVSAFGFSGTNAHLVLEEAPSIERSPVELPASVIALSARTSEQLTRQVRNLVTHLRASTVSMADLSYSLFVGRAHLPHRLSCVARNQDDLVQHLDAWLDSGAADQVYVAAIPEGAVREQVWLKRFGQYCIDECREAATTASYLESAAAIAVFVQGYALDYAALSSGDARRIPLPTYPFARERYWLDEGRASAPEPAAITTGGRPVHVETSANDLRARLQRELSPMVAEILNIDAGQVRHDAVPLDLGFDSIGLTTFANAINKKYQLDVTPVLFFDYPSLRDIARYLSSTERKDDVRRRHREVSQAAVRPVDEPIAIVGIAGVMPQSEDLDALWDHLKNTRDLITVIPEDRWAWEEFYGDPLREVNTSNSKWGGFMKAVDTFDPLFFGISPREAQMMDPQQRIFLETAWKAIEDAGHRVSDLSGTRTGLFVGVGSHDYLDVMRSQADALDAYTASGNSHSVLANRVSFLLNLRGPSAPIDTACSSSLVAVHRAVESIRAGGCDMAIVGGVQVILSPGAYISFGMAGMLSRDGTCKAFDKRANGYVRGEGCGALLLKPLSAAEADRNHIYALITGTSENHGGRVTTMTAPNSAAQTELLLEAYEKARIDPTTVGYIECHGTGTSLGDPIEVQALRSAFAELYKRHNAAPAEVPHCGLGTIKTNIGHLETAAGIAGVLKVVLALEHKQIPATAHFQELNPYIDLRGTPFFIVDSLTPWQSPSGPNGSVAPRRAGVSSFGFGGANAHAVLEEYVPPVRQAAAAAPGQQVIVLSAKDSDRLLAYVRAVRAALERRDADLVDIAYTLQVGRDEMPERLALVVSSIDEIKNAFDTIVTGEAPPQGCFRARAVSGDQAPDATEAAARTRPLIEQQRLTELAEMWVSGARVDWRLLHASGRPNRIPLPTYPFARERYWIPGVDRGIRHGGTTAVPSERAVRRSAAAFQDVEGGQLQSFIPAWSPIRIDRSQRMAFPESTRVLVLGHDLAHVEWVRRAYPGSPVVHLALPSSIDGIEAALRDVSFDQLLWIAPDVGSHAGGGRPRLDAIVAQQDDGVLTVFRMAKALLRLGYGERTVGWTLLTSRTQPVADGDAIEPAHAAVLGLIGSLAKENPRWNVRLLDVESLASVNAEDCLTLPWDTHGNALAYRRGEWLRQDRAPVPAAPVTMPLYRRNGVYVVIGGAGGIGEVWSRFMVEQYDADVVWIGRRPQDAAIERTIAGFARLGRTPLYVSADATDPGELERACRTILKAHPAVHGVVHSAVVLHDQSIAGMDEWAFRAGLSAKVDISVNIDRVFGGHALDFMLFFSSIASFIKPAGQSNYAAGCTFKDSFARALAQRRSYPVKVMNWGYWGDVGVAADNAHRDRMTRVGLGSIDRQEGMAALLALMSSAIPQVGLLKTVDVKKDTNTRSVDGAALHVEAADITIAGYVRRAITEALCDELRIDAARIVPAAPMTDYGVDSIVGVNLVRRIGEAFGIPLEPSRLFDCRTIDLLTDDIVNNWREQIAARAALDQPSPPASASDAGVDRFLEAVRWQESACDASYEKVTF